MLYNILWLRAKPVAWMWQVGFKWPAQAIVPAASALSSPTASSPAHRLWSRLLQRPKITPSSSIYLKFILRVMFLKCKYHYDIYTTYFKKDLTALTDLLITCISLNSLIRLFVICPLLSSPASTLSLSPAIYTLSQEIYFQIPKCFLSPADLCLSCFSLCLEYLKTKN